MHADHDVGVCGDGVCVCMCTVVQHACVYKHSCGSISKDKKREGQERFLNIYLHVVNNQKLHTVPLMHKIWERLLIR